MAATAPVRRGAGQGAEHRPRGRGRTGGGVPGRGWPVLNMRVVLDTNVIISTLNFPGNERLVLELALAPG